MRPSSKTRPSALRIHRHKSARAPHRQSPTSRPAPSYPRLGTSTGTCIASRTLAYLAARTITIDTATSKRTLAKLSSTITKSEIKPTKTKCLNALRQIIFYAVRSVSDSKETSSQSKRRNLSETVCTSLWPRRPTVRSQALRSIPATYSWTSAVSVTLSTVS